MIAVLLTLKAIENAIGIGLAVGIIIVAAAFVVKVAAFLKAECEILYRRFRVWHLTRQVNYLKNRRHK